MLDRRTYVRPRILPSHWLKPWAEFTEVEKTDLMETVARWSVEDAKAALDFGLQRLRTKYGINPEENNS